MASNTGKVFGLLAAGAAAFGVYKLAKKDDAIGKLQIVIQNIKIGFANAFMQVKIDLLVKNPTRETLRFKNFVGKIYVDSQSLGNIDIANPVNILPRTDTPVVLSASVPVTNILKSLASFLFTKSVPTKGIVDGVVSIGDLKFKIYKEIPFNPPTTK
jgi:hypothetical protein